MVLDLNLYQLSENSLAGFCLKNYFQCLNIEIIMIRIVGLIASVLFLTGCSEVTYPPVSKIPNQEVHQGQFVWYDLASHNPELAMAFYGKVFGWEFESLEGSTQGYNVIRMQGEQIGGVFGLDPMYGEVAEWVSIMSVSNVREVVGLNEEKGGKTLYKPTMMKGRGMSALIQDPQGAFVGVLRSDSGDPSYGEIRDHDFLWTELWTNDLSASLTHYKTVLGLDHEEIEVNNNPYFILKKDDRKLSGAFSNPIEGARSVWVPYIKVNDVKEITELARNEGAHIMLEPDEKVRNGTVAVLMDPTGAQFVIQEYEANLKNL
jgi:predicted enzyme related to lactoylglutathione lyase